jgi:hypothetical protein
MNPCPTPDMPPVYVPRGYDYGPTNRIAELMLQQGRARAEGAARSGEIWGNAIGQIGQQVGQYVQERAGRKRDTAVTDFITSWDGKDPQALLAGLTKIAGPELGPKYAQGTLAFHNTATVHQDPAAELSGLGMNLDLLKGLDDENAARVWPHFRQRYGPTAQSQFGMAPEQIPEAWDPRLRPVLEKLRSVLPGAPKPEKVGTREVKTRNPDGSERIQIVEDKPGFEAISAPAPVPPRPGHVVTTPGPGGRPITRLASDEELAAGVPAFREPRQASDELVKVEHKDDATGRTVIEWLPKSQLRGRTFQKGTSATTETRLASAQAVNQTGEDLIAKLSDPKFAAVVGPAMGRASTLRDFLGNPPPEFSDIAGTIESYALANMGVHGMRSAQGAEQIKKLLDQRHTPASLAAAIKGLNRFSSHFMENEGRGTTGAGPAGAAPAAGPQKGARKTIGGVQAEWDGKAWREVVK